MKLLKGGEGKRDPKIGGGKKGSHHFNNLINYLSMKSKRLPKKASYCHDAMNHSTQLTLATDDDDEEKNLDKRHESN